MAHADVCPCKHLRLVCLGQCLDCLTEQYGAAGAAELVERDGAAPPYPHGDSRDDPLMVDLGRGGAA